ncbi:hypothetical protein ACFP8W_18215 [Nocardioides hankookensis]|uniref:Uncharacterized protein n=1 Tax=Nocardioides hankookensis TaxID=443157 RepID=A0ABW1LP66_9ACTN
MRRIVSGAVALLFLLFLPALTGRAAAQDAPDHERTSGRTVYYNGWGGLRLGMTHQQAWRTGMVSHVYGHCAPGYEMRPAYRDRGFVVWRDRRPAPFKVQEIVVRGADDRTVAGAGVGTTLRELRRLYPDLTRVTGASEIDNRPGRDRKDLWIASASKKWGTLNFQFAYGARPGARAKVEMIVVSHRQEVYWGC